MGINAVVMAGDREASKNILGQNKAFLEVNGKPILFYVLEALDESVEVERIVLVGPKFQLEKQVATFDLNTPLIVIEQKENVFENAWVGFLSSLPESSKEIPENELEKKYADFPILIVAADIPLLVGAEIDYFINHADLGEHDMICGVTPARAMRKFYPSKSHPGIKMVYFHFKGFSIRQSNIMLIKPLQVKNKDYIRIMYRLRHQKSFLQAFRLAATLLRIPEGTFGILYDYFFLQFNMQLSRFGLDFLLNITNNFTSLKRVCHHVSILLSSRFGLVMTPLGGATLDADNEEDYHAMKQMFVAWKKEQRRIGLEIKKEL